MREVRQYDKISRFRRRYSLNKTEKALEGERLHPNRFNFNIKISDYFLKFEEVLVQDPQRYFYVDTSLINLGQTNDMSLFRLYWGVSKLARFEEFQGRFKDLRNKVGSFASRIEGLISKENFIICEGVYHENLAFLRGYEKLLKDRSYDEDFVKYASEPLARISELLKTRRSAQDPEAGLFLDRYSGILSNNDLRAGNPLGDVDKEIIAKAFRNSLNGGKSMIFTRDRGIATVSTDLLALPELNGLDLFVGEIYLTRTGVFKSLVRDRIIAN